MKRNEYIVENYSWAFLFALRPVNWPVLILFKWSMLTFGIEIMPGGFAVFCGPLAIVCGPVQEADQ